MFYVYAIADSKETYIGYSKNPKKRIKDHRSRCWNINERGYSCKFYKYVREKYSKEESFSIFNNYKIIIKVKTEEEAKEYEQLYIDLIGTLNTYNSPTNMTPSEYNRKRYLNNKEHILEQHRKYKESPEGIKKRTDNYAQKRDSILSYRKERVICDKCGHKSSRSHKARHIKEGKCIKKK